MRPVDEGERDKDIWLDPLTRGSELHELYAALLRRARDENRRANKEDGAWLIALAQERLRRLNEEMPAATLEIFERESRDFLADVAVISRSRIRSTRRRRQSASRCRFGRPLDDDNEPLARPEAVEIDLGKGITFRIAGRIDRIDKVGPASFEVLDYKTGGYWRDNWKGVIQWRASSPARAIWTRRRRTAQDPSTRIQRSLLVSITSRATRDARSA